MTERSGSEAQAPMADSARIRNVALVGHSGAGKTTLVEALLLAAGTSGRGGRGPGGTPGSDVDEGELRPQGSGSLSLAAFEYDGIKVNLLDTPGYADFVGELRAGLRAADAALFVVSAAEGIDGATRLIWSECAAVGLPRAVMITRLDSARADVEATLTACQEAFGANVLPLYLPSRADDGRVVGLVDLVSERVAEHSGGRRLVRPQTPPERRAAAGQRAALVEGIIAESEDETLMDRYLGGQDIDPAVLMDDLETAVARGAFHPVLLGCALDRLGMVELLAVLTRAFPAPSEHPAPAVSGVDGTTVEPLACDPDGPLAAEVVKTTTDPYVGRISLARIFSGTLRPGCALHVCGHGQIANGHDDHDAEEKAGSLASPLGKAQRTVPYAVAGDLVSIARLARAETGDTLSDPADPLFISTWQMPEPLLPVAIQARSKSDEAKLSLALSRIVAEEPTVRLERNTETGQLVLWCMGEAHADVLLDRMAAKYGVAVEQTPLQVPLRTTFAAPASGHGRHVKQSGGHGRFGVCDIEVEPSPPGSGYEFVDRVFGGAVPHQFIPSVDKGIRAQMAAGLLGGHPLVDLRVSLTGGKAHAVDSSDLAFQLAGMLALRDAAGRSEVVLLEPVLECSVIVADEHVGSVMSDLGTRRGRVTRTESVGSGRSVIRAEVPEAELTRYAIDLRSLSHGTGTFTRTHLRYDPVPTQVARTLITPDGAGRISP